MSDEKSKKWVRRSFPRHTLEQALKLAQTIQNSNVGKPMNRLLLAGAVGVKPTSSEFRDLLSSSYKYGLTEGTEKADNISLTETGQKITKPLSPEDKYTFIKKAVLTPDVFGKVYNHYNGGKFPAGTFFENTLETVFKIPREYVKEALILLGENGRYAHIIRDISGSPYIMLEGGTPDISSGQQEMKESHVSEDEKVPEDVQQQEKNKIKSPVYDKPEKPKPIFIAHGKNKKLLEQLKKILDQFKIPYIVALDEPHSGRPISQKVRELMQGCGSALFIFSSEFESGGEDDRCKPNSNVVFEMGAASVLYDDKIIIFKEEDLELPSDFSDLGYISFEKNKLDSKAFELMRELVALGFIKFVSV